MEKIFIMEDNMLDEIDSIVVDLDGTLIEKDSSFLIWRQLMRSNIYFALRAMCVYMFKGEAKVKELIKASAMHSVGDGLQRSDNQLSIDYKINHKLVAYLRNLKSKKILILATGANISVARAINEKYQLFDKLIASDSQTNCIGMHKLAEIKKNTHKFMYIGDHWYDCPIWFSANMIGVVKPNAGLLLVLHKHAKNYNKTVVVFE